MDSNLNIPVAIIFNGCFSLNVHLLLATENWKLKYKLLIPEWFDIVGKIEAFSSLGNFSFNNPDFINPKAVNESFILHAKNMGHPLIPKDTCVKNDIRINGWKQISIVTGANMSGKSTMLRTIGTNYILAMTGCSVCADEFIFTPIEIHTSMRTNDSLAKKESYFYAELKRLKEIIDELEKGKQKFILLDEILKGTNSNDKRTGSMALINQLLKYDIIAMVATHDQVLGDLINEYPANISNRCFEISIVNDKMHIDYKIREGVCQNLNATFLMKNMGIIFPEN
jgi:DNA mismatch repair ATPase MutS